jgi:pimeloyl-ACP methyl ester carboxylesterase
MFLQSSAQAEAILERARRLPAQTGAALWLRMVRWDVEHLDAAFASVRAPLMAIQSTWINAERKRLPLRDGESSPWLDLVRSKLPNARIEIVAGVGHFTQLEAPDRVNRLIHEFSTT